MSLGQTIPLNPVVAGFPLGVPITLSADGSPAVFSSDSGTGLSLSNISLNANCSPVLPNWNNSKSPESGYTGCVMMCDLTPAKMTQFVYVNQGALTYAGHNQGALTYLGYNQGALTTGATSSIELTFTNTTEQGKLVLVDPSVRAVCFEEERGPSVSNECAISIEQPLEQSGEMRFKLAFHRAITERFEDGMTSKFSKELEHLVQSCTQDSGYILSCLLKDSSISSDVWAEALRWIGRTSVLPYQSRLRILEEGLASSSPEVRDGAILGLSFVDDPQTAPYLSRAIKVENIPQLRSDMEEVLEQLRSH